MRLILPVIFGLGGAALLVALGLWQLQRLEWKEGMIADMASRIGAPPIALPRDPDPSADNFVPVSLNGRVDGRPLRVLGAWREGGAGFRIIAPVETEDGRRVMVDLGIVPLDNVDREAEVALTEGPLEITGNLNWPDDLNPGTPDPDGEIWFARDVDSMAETLGTERVMIVARNVVPEAGPVPVPVGLEGIPNNHLGYAIQWFGLALVWLGMTVFLLWRIRRRTI